MWAQSPLLAAAVSFTVGTVVLFITVFVLRYKIPSLRGESNQTKWWHWIGGVLGSYLVAANIFLVPIVGASVLVALVLAGNLGAAVVLDHFGVIGFKKRPINIQRILGVALLFAGVLIVSYIK
jgi:transporter family-2 protein